MQPTIKRKILSPAASQLVLRRRRLNIGSNVVEIKAEGSAAINRPQRTIKITGKVKEGGSSGSK